MVLLCDKKFFLFKIISGKIKQKIEKSRNIYLNKNKRKNIKTKIKKD